MYLESEKSSVYYSFNYICLLYFTLSFMIYVTVIKYNRKYSFNSLFI